MQNWLNTCLNENEIILQIDNIHDNVGDISFSFLQICAMILPVCTSHFELLHVNQE